MGRKGEKKEGEKEKYSVMLIIMFGWYLAAKKEKNYIVEGENIKNSNTKSIKKYDRF